MLLLLWLMAFGHPKPAINPSRLHAIAAGSTIQFKSSVPVKWSLAPGSPGTINENGVYHAPSHVPVHNELAGCQILPNDHILNTRIDALPLHPKSAVWNSILPNNHLNYYPAWGTNIGDSQTPLVPIEFLYSPENNGKYEIPAWPRLQRENGVFSSPLTEVDRHVLTVDRESCMVYEIYNNYPAGINPNCKECTAQGGASYQSLTYALPKTSSDAAGLYLAPLTLRLSEIRSGHIQHVLRFTLANAYIAPSSAWPSTAHAGAWGQVPYGTRFRLRADYDDSAFSPIARILIRQLKEYGLMIADGGANWEIETSTDVTLDPAVEAALLEVGQRGPVARDFQAVDESDLMIAPNSGQIRYRPSDVKDDAAVTIVATDASDPTNANSIRIPIQAITIGVPEPSLWIQSGVKAQLTAWVNGTDDKGLTWIMSPPLGNLTAAGSYTAPIVDHPTLTTITAASHADPEAKTSIGVTIMPPGAIRVDVGNATRAPNEPNKHAPDYGPDSERHMWWHDMAGEVSWGVVKDDWYGETWPKQKDIGLFYTSRYSFGDMIYRFLLPNGNYKVNIYFARPGCKGQFPKHQIAPIHVETQGKIILHDFDPGLAEKYTCNVPAIQSIPATVTDNSFYFALRRITLPPDITPAPLLNAYSIVPDGSAPKLTIDPGDPPNLIAGDHIHLYAIGWYMDNNVQWSLKGPGSIDADGIYSAPVTSPSTDTVITVIGRSLTVPGRSAELKLNLKSTPLLIKPESATVVRSLSQRFSASFGSAPDENVQWSMTPNVGTITPNGVFTAPNSLASDTNVILTARSKDLPDRTATATIHVKVAPDIIRIHCGDGPAFKDGQGNIWAADYGYSKETVTYRDAVPIAGASQDMQYLYQSSRYRYPDQPFKYTFSVPNGKYAVTLKFADYAHNEAGNYSFDVRLNGRKVLSNFDPDKERGPKTANDKTFETQVSDKTIRLDFLAYKGAAFINGIEIRYLGQ